MELTPITAIQGIQAVLAPALGISAVGLLLLALNNRYSAIVNRIRLLNDEKRRYHKLLADNVQLHYTENARYQSIRNQMEGLLMRSRLIRNAIIWLQIAIGLFVLTSVAIGMSLFVAAAVLASSTLVIFVCGMVCVLVGIVFAALEIARSFRIVLIEVNAEE
jgi:hypothetical protein